MSAPAADSRAAREDRGHENKGTKQRAHDPGRRAARLHSDTDGGLWFAIAEDSEAADVGVSPPRDGAIVDVFGHTRLAAPHVTLASCDGLDEDAGALFVDACAGASPDASVAGAEAAADATNDP